MIHEIHIITGYETNAEFTWM